MTWEQGVVPVSAIGSRVTICLFLLMACELIAGLKSASAATTACPLRLARAADSAVATIHDWSDLYVAFRRYKSCDDGAIAEGFSDRVTTLLATNWNVIGRLGQLMAEDHDFRKFVLRHIDETADEKNLKSIIANLNRQGCPGMTRAICSDIRKQARDALDRLSQ